MQKPHYILQEVSYKASESSTSTSCNDSFMSLQTTFNLHANGHTEM